MGKCDFSSFLYLHPFSRSLALRYVPMGLWTLPAMLVNHYNRSCEVLGHTQRTQSSLARQSIERST